MVEYRVVFTPQSDAEILASYEWGVRSWGEDQARSWLLELYFLVFRSLKVGRNPGTRIRNLTQIPR